MFYKKTNGLRGRASKCKSCFLVSQKKYRTNNKNKTKLYHKKWSDKNKGYQKEYYYDNLKYCRSRSRDYRKIKCDELDDSYILKQLHLKRNECPVELIEQKRLQLKLFREIRN